MLSRFVVETNKRLMSVFVVPGGNVRVSCRGISQSDIAVLVVDPSPVEFDACFAKNGRAAEHVLLAYTFGLKEVVLFFFSLFVVFQLSLWAAHCCCEQNGFFACEIRQRAF
jgi:hypothetical protein